MQLPGSNVWRAFLRVQFVRGDLTPFLDQAGRQVKDSTECILYSQR